MTQGAVSGAFNLVAIVSISASGYHSADEVVTLMGNASNVSVTTPQNTSLTFTINVLISNPYGLIGRIFKLK